MENWGLSIDMKPGTLPLEDFQIDLDSPMPVYLQLRSFIAEAIRSGTLRGGDVIPSERRLADALSISRMTVRRAIDDLVEQSLIKRVRGSGTYILPSQVQQPITKLQGFSEEARSMGFVPGSTIIEIAYVAANSRVASALGIEVSDQVLRITRLRTANGIPLAIQVAHISPRLMRFPVEDFRACGSLYEVIAKHYSTWPHRATQTVGARLPTTEECRLLEITPSTPVLSLERVTYDETGFPFEYVQSAYRGDRYQVWAELRAAGASLWNPSEDQPETWNWPTAANTQRPS